MYVWIEDWLVSIQLSTTGQISALNSFFFGLLDFWNDFTTTFEKILRKQLVEQTIFETNHSRRPP